MWFSLMHVRPEETPDADGADLALVAMYRADGSRLMRVQAPVGSAPEVIRTLRTASHGAPRGRPRCQQCGADLGAPDLDDANPEG